MRLAAPIYTIIFIAGSAATGAAYVASTISVPGFAQMIPEVVTTPVPPDPVVFSTLLYKTELTGGQLLVAPLPARQSAQTVIVGQNIEQKSRDIVVVSDQHALTAASSLWPRRIRTTRPATASSSGSPAAVRVSLRPTARSGPDSTPTKRPLVKGTASQTSLSATQLETDMARDLTYTIAIQEKDAAYAGESSRDKSNRRSFDLLEAMRHFHGVLR